MRWIAGYKPGEDLILADGATAITLPSDGAGILYPDGFVIQVMDNTGTFAGTNCVVSVVGAGMQIDGATSVTLATAYQVRAFRKAGGQWV
jgi:hypothetical protein